MDKGRQSKYGGTDKAYEDHQQRKPDRYCYAHQNQGFTYQFQCGRTLGEY